MVEATKGGVLPAGNAARVSENRWPLGTEVAWVRQNAMPATWKKYLWFSKEMDPGRLILQLASNFACLHELHIPLAWRMLCAGIHFGQCNFPQFCIWEMGDAPLPWMVVCTE